MDLSVMLEGLMRAFTPLNIIWIVFGVVLGMITGTLPGISGPAMLAIILPITYKMPLETMVMAITGLYAADIYSASTAGILYNIPGGAPGIPTTIEGYRLTLQGRAHEALSAACGASFFGNTFGVLAMLVLIPFFQYIVTFFGAAERSLFALWAMVLISVGVLTREDPVKGLISMGIGLSFTIMGIQPNDGTVRYVGGIPNLWDGVDIMWIVMGLYAVPQLLLTAEIKGELEALRIQTGKRAMESWREFYKLTFSYIAKNFRLMCRTSLLGTVIGIVPGIGSIAAGWLAYSYAAKAGKEADLVGQGSVEAICCIETANNAALPGALIPMFSLGLPGSSSAAIILSIFVMAGLHPGPQLLQQHGSVVWCIVCGILLCGAVFLLLAYPFRAMCGYLLSMPVHWMVSVIGAMVIMGGYMAKGSLFGANASLVIAVLAVVLTWLGIPVVGVLLGNVLGDVIENDMLRAYHLGGFARFTTPQSLFLIAMVLITLGLGVYSYYVAPRLKKNRGGDKKPKRSLKMVGQEEEKTDTPEQRAYAEGKNTVLRLIAGISAAFVAALLFAGTRKFPGQPALWPRVVYSLFFFLPAGIMLVQAVTDRQKLFYYLQNRKSKTDKEKRATFEAAGIFVLLVFSSNLIELIGTIECVALFAFLVSTFLNPKKPFNNALAAVVVGAVVWAMKTGFSFFLPSGLLGI